MKPYDILIIGAGPTGLVLANLLGGSSCRIVIVDSNEAPFPIPRATHIDEETLRNFQATGLLEKLLPFTSPFGDAEVRDTSGRLILKESIAEKKSVHGYASSFFFDQPAFEKTLREGLNRFANIETYFGYEAVSIANGEDSVAVVLEGKGESLKMETLWLVGCDGGRSMIRKSLGVEMDSLTRKRNWMIVDTLLKNEADAKLLPENFTYRLGDDRLSIYAHGFGKNRRWEFQLAEHEDSPDDARALSWVAKDIDLGKLEVTRVAMYAHNALVAQSWVRGRIIIAGDAAHMMPPSAGQGMCSGVRDALNLAWKLAAVVQGKATEALIETYELERKPHLEDVLKSTLLIGDMLQADTPGQKTMRRLKLRGLSLFPFAKNALRRVIRQKNRLREGFLHPSKLQGMHAPQTEVFKDGKKTMSDDLHGYGFVLVYKDASLNVSQKRWAESKGFSVFEAGVDFTDPKHKCLKFMNKNGMDYLLIRPDRIVFSAGRANVFHEAQKAFERFFR